MAGEAHDLDAIAARDVERRVGVERAGVEQIDVVDGRVGDRFRGQRHAQAERAGGTGRHVGAGACEQGGARRIEAAHRGGRGAIRVEGDGLHHDAGLQRQWRGISGRAQRRRAAVDGIADRAIGNLRRQRERHAVLAQRIAARAGEVEADRKGAVGDAHAGARPAIVLALQAGEEGDEVRRPVALDLGRPGDFGERAGAREDQMLELPRRDDIFAPQIALRAEDVMRLVRGDALGQRIVGIDLLQRGDVEPAGRLVAAAALQAVEVERVARRHDDVMPHVGGVDPALFAAPRHDRGGGGQAALQDLVPADQAAALGLKVGAELFDHPALQRVFGLDAQRLHLRLHLGAAFPLILDRLVAAEVDIGAGEDRHQLVEHVLDEGDALRPRIEQIGHDAPIVADQRPVAEDAELRIGGDERIGVAGQVDLRHDGDAAHAGIGDQLLQLRLGVEAADAILFGRLRATRPGRQAPAADAGELGVFLDLDAPALIVRQMEVQRVELYARHLVDDRAQRRQRQEVARGVDH